MKRIGMAGILMLVLTSVSTVKAGEAADYEDPADFPLMGDWAGSWIDPIGGHEKEHPELYAQVLPMEGNLYRIALLPDLYLRSEPYLDVMVREEDGRLVLDHQGFKAVFEDGRCHGEAILHHVLTKFELKKVPFASPTLGMPPPEGAVVLFDGSSHEAWQHTDGRPFSWTIEDGVLEVHSGFWNNRQNAEAGIGGMIATRRTFGSCRIHLEFRYPVEQGKTGQDRGNSGVFLHPLCEVQILNSYMTPGYYDECGALYRMSPPKVNAAGPPLQWQTYDIELEFPEALSEPCKITVRLNGRTVHNKLELDSAVREVTLMLQDHINRIQFRNIWVLPLTD